MTLKNFIMDFYRERSMVFNLAKRDITSRYMGSSLGTYWAIIHPVLLILTYWVVFQVGFRSVPVENVPFILWLLAGIIPWFFFADSVSSATYSVENSSFLVKKVVFKTHLLPLVKIISALFIHVFFLVITFVIFGFYRLGIDIYILQIFYYLFAMVVLLVGMSWITSSLNIFLKDIGQLVSVILQFGFWLTPIFWSFNLIPDKLKFLFKLNPMFYIVEGYRDSLINKVWFWHHYNQTLFFWLIAISLLLVGSYVFKKLSLHFADVL